MRCERKLPLTPHTLHPAFEDGTDTGFRNIGQLQFDAGEIPKRTYTMQEFDTLCMFVSLFYVHLLVTLITSLDPGV